MSAVSEWASRQPVGNPTRKLVLIALGMSVPVGTSRLTVELPIIAEIAEVTPRTARGHIQALEEMGYLSRAARYGENGAQTANEIRLNVPPELEEALRMAPVARDRGGPPDPLSTAPDTGDPGVAGDRGVTRAGETVTTSSSSRSARELQWPLDAGGLTGYVPEPAQRDAVALFAQRPKVNGRVVTAEEMVLAAVCMAEFNRQASKDQGLGPSLPAIVGRIREHPTWDAEKHRRLVQSAFRIRWWERQRGRENGRPRALRPNVIYGNTECFANVAADAADEFLKREEQIVQRRGEFDRAVVRDD